MSNFLSQFTSFSGWFLGMQGSSVFTSLPGLLGPTQEGAQPLFKQAPVAYVNCVSPLAWDFIDFLCKSRHISLSSLLYSLNWKFFPHLYIYSPFTSPFKLWIPWMQLGKDPGKGPFPCLVGKGIQAFPSHLKGRHDLMLKLERNSRDHGTIQKDPDSQSTPFTPDSNALTGLSPWGSTQNTMACVTALWHLKRKPQIPMSTRQETWNYFYSSRGKWTSMSPHEMRPDSPVEIP